MTRTVQEAPSRGNLGLLGMGATIAALHLVGWGVFFVTVLPQSYRLGEGTVIFGTGLAITAYLLGVRHAFDADHIAAIDNTTRKLTNIGRRPETTGFWFALGHSTVVVAAVGLLAAGVNALAGQLADDGSVLKQVAGIWGPAVAGGFLLLIGTLNLVSLVGIYHAFQRLKSGHYNEEEFDEYLNRRGLLNRLLGPLSRQIDKPSKMYPLGLLFGLGLDTATTIGLFVVAGGAVIALPWHVVMVLPLLFTAGMVLFDSLDGVLMSRVYLWAFKRPTRKIFYNFVITSVSVAVAFLVGLVVLSGLFADLFQISEGPVAWISSLDLENFGFAVVGIFIAAWLTAFAVWKLGKLDGKYMPSPES